MIQRKDATTAKAEEVYRVLRESKQAMPVAGRSTRFNSERKIFGAAWS
jgi:hypothetical protein